MLTTKERNIWAIALRLTPPSMQTRGNLVVPGSRPRLCALGILGLLRGASLGRMYGVGHLGAIGLDGGLDYPGDQVARIAADVGFLGTANDRLNLHLRRGESAFIYLNDGARLTFEQIARIVERLPVSDPDPFESWPVLGREPLVPALAVVGG